MGNRNAEIETFTVIRFKGDGVFQFLHRLFGNIKTEARTHRIACASIKHFKNFVLLVILNPFPIVSNADLNFIIDFG